MKGGLRTIQMTEGDEDEAKLTECVGLRGFATGLQLEELQSRRDGDGRYFRLPSCGWRKGLA